jgi:hypothetical protein
LLYIKPLTIFYYIVRDFCEPKLNHCLKNKTRDILLVVILLLIASAVSAQLKIKGKVYDRSTVFPLPYVSVMTNSGKGTVTDSNGNFVIELMEKDSIWFSYLGKTTNKFGKGEIDDPEHFNISLLANVSNLPEVKVKPGNYKLDSIQNRIDYAKAFNYQKPDFKSIVPVVGLTVIVDIDELIRAFQYRKKRNALDFQKRLIEQEREKLIDHRFNKGLVTKLTGLREAERDSFMIQWHPGYYFTKTTSDYDFNFYIKESFKKFREKCPAKKIDE